MKNKIFYTIIAVFFFGALTFGVYFRFSYTNVTAEENYLDKLQVGEIPEELCIKTCNSLAGQLPSTPIILRVSPVSEIEHQFGRSLQKVVVKQVFAGKELSVGEEIYITSIKWSVIIRDDGWSIERGFVNIMRDGSDYLVFLLNYSGMENEGAPVYFLNVEEFIAPVFCYDDIPNIIITPSGEDTYVPYVQVSDNEFFTTSQTALDAWCALKQEMLKTYQ